MSFIYYKTPDEIERIGVNFMNRLGASDAVSSGTEVITDADGTDVTATMMVAGSEALSDENGDGANDTITIKVKAGTDGEDYKLVIQATTTSGNKKEEVIIIRVQEVEIA